MKAQQIRIWLLRKGHKQMDIARDLGVSKNLVWRTVHGLENNHRVCQWLLDRGCPEKYVGLPKKRAA